MTMTIVEAVRAITDGLRAECVYSTSSDSYDADSLLDWAYEQITAEEEASEDGEPLEYVVTDGAIHEMGEDGYVKTGEAVVILRTLDGWDWENAKRTVFGTEPARLPESTWPSLEAWRAWAVAR